MTEYINPEHEKTPDVVNFQANKIKLIKNSRGYSWEISLLSHDVEKLKEINQKMAEEFEENRE